MSANSENQFALRYLKERGLSVNITLNRDDLELVLKKVIKETLSEVSKSNDDELIPMCSVRKLLGVSSTTLWKWHKSGYLNRVKVGKSIFYERREIQKFLQKK